METAFGGDEYRPLNGWDFEKIGILQDM